LELLPEIAEIPGPLIEGKDAGSLNIPLGSWTFWMYSDEDSGELRAQREAGSALTQSGVSVLVPATNPLEIVKLKGKGTRHPKASVQEIVLGVYLNQRLGSTGQRKAHPPKGTSTLTYQKVRHAFAIDGAADRALVPR
jgi:hypothetical protein